MRVIPAINCKNFTCIKRRIKKAAEFLPKNSWIQIDISDGKFTKAKTWNSPLQLKKFLYKNKIAKFNLEVHLMVNDFGNEIKKWQEAGAKRIIIHLEALENCGFKLTPKNSKNLGLAIKPSTSVKKLVHFLPKIKFVQLLAVSPGYSGQQFDKLTIKKIEFLKKNYPKVKIEIDGGMNEETAKLIKKAGADFIVSGSYLFNSNNFRKRYISLF